MRSLARTRYRRLAWGVLLLPATAGGLAACSEQPDPAAMVRVAIGAPQHLVPSHAHDPDSLQLLSALFAPLVEFDETGQPVAVAAESVEPDPAARVWTIRLREGFTFHNGEPVTSDSYLAAWNFGAYEPNQQHHRHLYARIEGFPELSGDPPAEQHLSGLAKVDDHTFTVTLAEPFADLRSVLSMPAFYPLPAVAFAAPGQLREEFPAAPIGNGRLRLAGGLGTGAAAAGQTIRLEPHPDYPGEPARVSGIELVVYPDPAAAYAALRDGEVDLVTRVPAGEVPGLTSDPGGHFVQFPAPAIQYLAVPSYLEELADPDIRRAISMAIDREQVAEVAVPGSGLPAQSFVPPGIPGARTDTCGSACAFDPATAQAQYARAGGPDRLTISYNADGGHRDWVELTCRQLTSNLGVKCVPESTPDLTELLARVDRQEPVGLLRLGWAMDYPSLESYLLPVFSTTGSANFSGFRNAEFDDLLAAAAAAPTQRQAVATYQRAEDLLARDLPVIPIRFGQHTAGYSPAIQGVTATRLGTIDLSRLAVTRPSLLVGRP